MGYQHLFKICGVYAKLMTFPVFPDL
uniref:Uncharacterized protein n=1 Tax=Arundo donax TaxID=35708 RepID=A0A0A9HM79_ARUDO